MKIDKEKLALAAQQEIKNHIRDNPLQWLGGIVDDQDDSSIALLGVMEEFYGKPFSERCRSAAMTKMIDDFAAKAGQSAYDSIIGHPGTVN